MIAFNPIPLRVYFETVFLPVHKPRAKVAAIYNLRTIVRAYCAFAGDDVLLTKITNETMEDFRLWLARPDTFNDETATSYRAVIRTIMRSWQPEKFPKLSSIFKIPEGGDGSLWNFYESTYRPLKLPDATDQTRRKYRVVIGQFGDHLDRTPALSDLSDEVVMAFGMSRIECGRSRATANVAIEKLVALWNLAARKRLVEEFPSVLIIAPEAEPWTCELVDDGKAAGDAE